MRLLVVDDSPLFRELIRRFLEDAPCEIVEEVVCAADAISAVGEHEPEVVVMDWSLPDHDGIWATREIKALYPNVDVVALTSTTDPGVAAGFAEAGATALIDKGDLDSLVRWVGRRAGPRSA